MKSTNKSYSYQRLSHDKNISVDFIKAYQEQDVPQMLSFFTPRSTIWFKPLGEDGRGKVLDFGKTMWSALIDAFPDLDNTIHSTTSADGHIQCVVSIRGTQRKDFAGIPSKGQCFDSEHIFVFTLSSDHQIDHLDIDWNHPEFVRQLSEDTARL